MMKKLFKKDNNGNIRVWWIDIEGNSFKIFSGVHGGKIVETPSKFSVSKNVGKANETTPEKQAQLEAESLYTKQLAQGGYKEIFEDAMKDESLFFKPMLAENYTNFKQSLKFPVYSQPKLDGIRCVATPKGLFTRNGKPIVSVPHIIENLKKFFEEYDMILDGELYNHSLHDDFNSIISNVRKTKPTQDDLKQSANLVEFHVFDIFDPSFKNGFFEYRSSIIEGIFDAFFNFPDCAIKNVKTKLVIDQISLDSIYNEYLEAGYEGQIIRKIDRPYENKRTCQILKRKEFESKEFEIADILPGVGTWANAAKSIVIYLEDRRKNDSGMRGTLKENEKILNEKEKYIGGQATVYFQGRTPDGKLRFPVVHSLYKGKREM